MAVGAAHLAYAILAVYVQRSPGKTIICSKKELSHVTAQRIETVLYVAALLPHCINLACIGQVIAKSVVLVGAGLGLEHAVTLSALI